MARCRVDTSVERVVIEGYEFPLGVYPVEPMHPKEGYTLTFESADSDPQSDVDLGTGGLGSRGSRESHFDEHDDELGPDLDAEGEPAGMEQWPDRYVFDINIRASRVEPLCRMLFALLPGRVYPILDVMGNDAYREIDPYIAYDLVGIERFLDALRRFRGWFYEDGLVGFGAMSEEPFYYVFVDEHKVVTVRAEASMKDTVERVLKTFDLQEVERISAADAAVHEHRGVLDAPANRPDLLTHEEIIEELRDYWGLTLNIDPNTNFDPDGHDLGIVPWRCIVRVFDDSGDVRYAEVLVTADCLANAGDLAVDAAQELLDLDETEGFPSLGRPGSGGLSGRRGGGGTGGAGSPRATGGVGGPIPPSIPSRRRGELDEPDEENDPLVPDDELGLAFDLLSADRLRNEEVTKVTPLAPSSGSLDLRKNAVIDARWMD